MDRRLEGRRGRPAWLSWRARIAVIAALVVLLVVVGLLVPRTRWLLLGPELGSPGAGGFGVSLASTSGRTPYTVGGMSVCVHGAGDVTVTGVRAVSSTGLRVSDFGVRPRPQEAFGAGAVTLRAAGFTSGGHVRTRCGARQSTELAVEFRKPSRATARADGLVVSWSNGRRTGHLTIGLHLVLCGGADEDVPSCRAIS